MDFGMVTVKIAIGLVLLFAITKILGKTQISQITPFDFISSIVLGEIFVHAVFEARGTMLSFVYPIVLWGVLIYGIEYLAEKFLPLRGFLEGRPAVVIRDGVIDRNEMRRNKLNIDQLLNLLRTNNVFSLGEVKYAILELNGSLSVLKNSSDAAPTRKDLKLPETSVCLPITLISDGTVLAENLRMAGFDRSWLTNQLINKNVTDVKQVFYAEWRTDLGLTISLR